MENKCWRNEGKATSGNRRIAWNNINDHTSRVVIFLPGKTHYYGTDFTVRMIDKKDDYKDKDFSTKKQALKYAKKYMKENC